MKRLKKMMALVIAMVMVLSMTSMAFASTPTNNRTLDGTINVKSLEVGDTVEFYRVLKFDPDAGSTGGWVADTGFTGLTTAQIQTMLGLDNTGKPAADRTTNPDNYGISATLAASIGDMAELATAKYNASSTPAVAYTDASGSRTATVTAPADGLYIAIIHPGKVGTIYNPVFVGADYTQPTSGEDGSSNWTVDLNDSYSPTSMAKKGQVTLDKTASTTEAAYEDSKPQTVAAGDTVNFTVDTTIPEFADSYTSAVFKVTDALSTGLEYQKDAKVYVVTKDANDNDVETELSAGANTFSIDNTATTGYTVEFVTKYLLDLNSATKIRIKYTAKVTTDAPTSVNIEKNTVTVNYSNSPTDRTGKGILKDETKHYTFDIDANLLGETSYHTSELVKVGLDKDGKEITETRELSNGHTIGALQGAKFKLYVADANSQTKIKDESGNEINASVYTNDIMTGDYYIESDADGRLTIHGQTTPGIRGLDAGTYYLVETEAPDGYIKAQNAAKIQINATIDNTNEVTEYLDEATGTLYPEQDAQSTRTEVKYTVPILTSYEVLINGKQTAKYTMTNEKPDQGDKDTPAETAVGENGMIGATPANANADAGKITNTQGVELPSTGGIGTTMFYIIGAILVLGAGILLVTRRRMNAN